jgi:hypothetical protein
MKSSLPLLTIAALLAGANPGVAASSKPHGNIMLAPPSVVSVTPAQSPTPQLNPGALVSPQFGMPPVNSGLIAPVTQQGINNQQNFGALPGAPGSATYDPNAALPSLDNPGTALAPNPGSSATGNQSVGSGQ